MDKISVIIPVYNVEKFLARCLDSVINQTYKNLEIICVNDCSPDDSAKILEDYAKKDKRIRIITFEQNRGQSCARNQGLKVSNGEYIYFLDSDDWIATDFIENIYGIAKNKNLEAVCTTDIVDVKEDLSEKKTYTTRGNRKICTLLQVLFNAMVLVTKKDIFGTFQNNFYGRSEIRRYIFFQCCYQNP